MIRQSEPIRWAFNAILVADDFIFNNASKDDAYLFDKKTGRITHRFNYNWHCIRLAKQPLRSVLIFEVLMDSLKGTDRSVSFLTLHNNDQRIDKPSVSTQQSAQNLRGEMTSGSPTAAAFQQDGKGLQFGRRSIHVSAVRDLAGLLKLKAIAQLMTYDLAQTPTICYILIIVIAV